MEKQDGTATTVVTPGNHDGVHRGHRALLDEARRLATPIGASVTALSFHPHPAEVLAPERAPAILTPIERRRELLLGRGADVVEVLTFDRALSSEAPESFVERVLVNQLHARAVVIGADFRFGKGAKGDVALLRQMGPDSGFTVSVLEAVEVDGSRVSSSRVRAALVDGDIELATRLLGRVHDVSGEVVLGHQRGRTIGVPTANLDVRGVLMPTDGVYAVIARVGEQLISGVANLGVRPTVEAGRSTEVHLLDFDRDLYGQTLRVGFVARLRGETKFDGLDALKAQIKRDIADAERALAAADRETWTWM
ncbi:MAG: bifunctional riboflavin kinase/FAD synthetase [Sandaracinaceae bacterium]